MELNYNGSGYGPMVAPGTILPPPNSFEKGICTPCRIPPWTNKTKLEMNDEELFLSTWESVYRLAEFDDVKDQIPKLRAYYAQMYASDGFDLDENPPSSLSKNLGLLKAPCCPQTHPELYERYMDVVRFVIHDYNAKNGTTFVVSKVDTVNRIANVTADIYYITFPASCEEEAEEKIFQAKVLVHNHPKEKIGFKVIDLCRIKP